MGHQENFILDQRDALTIVISVVLVVLVLLCCIFHIIKHKDGNICYLSIQNSNSNQNDEFAFKSFKRLAWTQNSSLAKNMGNTQLVMKSNGLVKQSNELVKQAEFGKPEDNAQ